VSESNLKFLVRDEGPDSEEEEEFYMNNGALVKLVDVHKVYRTGEMEVPAVRGVFAGN